jgi:phage shock protein A
MRNNALARKAELTQSSNENNSDDQQVARLRRREAKLTSQVQQLTNNLNVLVSENGKLKAQVDVSRNSRVIYSNVYKTIEKEIRKH